MAIFKGVSDPIFNYNINKGFAPKTTSLHYKTINKRVWNARVH